LESSVQEVLKLAKSLDGCFDRNEFSKLVTNAIKDSISSKEKGVKIRIIAELTNENIPDYKTIMSLVDLRHLDGVQGNFVIADSTEIQMYGVTKNGTPDAQILRSTVMSFVEQQQYIFDELWKKSIPATLRIAQVEEGIEPEITQVITGWESVFKDAVARFQNTRDRVDSCCDALVPPIIVNSPMHEASVDFVKRGGKVRLITEITKENLESVKVLMETQEVRHIGGFKLNFGLTSRSYIAPTSVYSISSEPQCISSTSQSVVKQHQYIFDELWNKATPARIRIGQLLEGFEPEITEIVTGWEGVIQKTMEGFSKAKERVDHCCDSLVPPRMVGSDVYKAMLEFTARRGTVRLITEITSENISAVKELMKTQQVRHINGFKLNFGVSEALFAAPTSVYSVSSEPQCIWSNSKGLISQHQYLFDGLWNIAVPADIRIREIEQGIAHEVIESISDPERIQKLAVKLVETAEKELLIIFSSTGAFILQLQVGLIELIEKRAKEGNVTIRIITPVDDRNRDIVNRWSKYAANGAAGIAVEASEISMQTMLSVIVADKSYSLAAEFKDRTSELTHGSMGLATYSNSKPTVLSYATIFESMWTQVQLNAEIRLLYDQLKIQDQQRKEFMDIAAHEFRNPLQPILFLTDILKRHSTDVRSQELLEVIIRNAKRLQVLQEEILDVAKIERQLLSLDKQIFSLNELVDEIAMDFNSQERESIQLAVHAESRLLVFADRTRLAQVITNMLNNSVKFTKQGTIEIKCERTAEGQAMLSVVDSGTGIDPEIFPRLFTKFASKSASGTGLGLYISKAVIEAHGGKIWAVNNNGAKGAQFSFTVPIASED